MRLTLLLLSIHKELPAGRATENSGFLMLFAFRSMERGPILAGGVVRASLASVRDTLTSCKPSRKRFYQQG